LPYMGLGFGTGRVVTLGLLAAGLAVCAVVGARGQSISLTVPGAPLLPAKFGEWKKIDPTVSQSPGYSFANTNKDALKECGVERTEVADYASGGRRIHIEADGFGDRTGAASAFSLLKQPGMSAGKELGADDAVGNGAVLFTVGSSVVLANFGGTVSAGDVASLKPMVAGLPKVTGSRGVAPLLPTLAPAKGLVEGSVRYALGPVTYAAEGGVLAASSVGWEKEPEAATALYDDARGKETLTMLLYPTPTIAGNFAKSVEGELGELGAKLGGTAKVRREGPLVILAAGSFSGEETQRLVENIHLREITFNQDVQPTFHIAAVQTFSLLTNIAILSGVLCSAAVLLGLFLGFGRATYRVMRGKPAAMEPEFLSLHLSPQNKPAEFHRRDSAQGG
jgi:hypothetical protein